MRYIYAGTEIGDSARLPEGHFISGQQELVQLPDVHDITLPPLGAGSRRTKLPLVVPTVFDTVREAEEFFATHYGSLPDTGTLEIVCGVDGDESTWSTDAILVACDMQVQGRLVTASYDFAIGEFTEGS